MLAIPTVEQLEGWTDAEREQYVRELAGTKAYLEERPDVAHLLTATKKQLRFIRSQKRVVVFFAGNKSGKTTAVSLKADAIALAEPGTEQWICSVDYPASLSGPEKSFWRIVPKEMLADPECFKPDSGFKNNCCVYKNGSIIRFKTYESTILGAQRIRAIYIDEEPKHQYVYDECFMRTADHPHGQLHLVWTAISGYTWSYHKLYKLKANAPPWLEVIVGITRENAHNLPPGTEDSIREQYSPAVLRARLYGEYVSIGGQSVFDIEKLGKSIDEAQPGERWVLVFMDNSKSMRRRTKDPGPHWRVFAEPVENREYVVGGDSATGYSTEAAALCVLDKSTLEVAATYGENVDCEVLAEQAVAMALWYNGAQIIGGRNGIDAGFMTALLRIGYSNLWREPSQPSRMPGLWISDTSRQLLVNDVINAVRGDLLRIWDESTLMEMSTFVYKPNGRTEHEEGCCDDRVFALAHALHGVLTATGQTVGVAPRQHMALNRLDRFTERERVTVITG